jgi:RNA recognition motif-containing protein
MEIRVGNLSPITSPSGLIGCFKVFGSVTNVTVNTYTVNGEIRGFGLVSMSSGDGAQAAIAGLRDKSLDGNLLTIREY